MKTTNNEVTFQELSIEEQEAAVGGLSNAFFACINPATGNLVFGGVSGNYPASVIGEFREICLNGGYNWYEAP